MADITTTVPFDLAGLRALDAVTRDLTRATQSFGKSVTAAFAGGVAEGKRFDEVLRGLRASLSRNLLQSALKPLQGAIASWLGSGIDGLFGAFGAGGHGRLPVSVFADGGVVAAPSYFAMGRGLGLMGERGAEAILPLSRGPDGKLGVRAGAADRRPSAVTVQITTPDAESFRRSEAQVSAAIARAVARGNRAL